MNDNIFVSYSHGQRHKAEVRAMAVDWVDHYNCIKHIKPCALKDQAPHPTQMRGPRCKVPRWWSRSATFNGPAPWSEAPDV